ncbi:MAG: putative transcriptional regulator [Halioglobus sp.]|jgi:predicted transcriptional regulator
MNSQNKTIFTIINNIVNMTTFTSSLPDDLLVDLNRVAAEQNLPKNKILEKSLKLYFEELEKQKWGKELEALSSDTEVISIAEEGIQDYYDQLKKYDKEG